jgi:large subunit ribosomal protein L18
MDIAAARLQGRQARHRRIRKKISGTNSRPRLAVFRTARHIYVQAIDDDQANTLACSSTLTIQKSLKKIYSGNKEAAKAVGTDIAKKLIEKSISSAVFDRGGYVFHGRVQALAEGAREAGLKF